METKEELKFWAFNVEHIPFFRDKGIVMTDFVYRKDFEQERQKAEKFKEEITMKVIKNFRLSVGDIKRTWEKIYDDK